jgi:hypothetical protein
MKELSDFNDELNGEVQGNTTLSIPTINFRNAMKYLILFISVTTATMVIPSCGVLRRHGVYVGLIGATTFAIVDMSFPNYVNLNK